MVPMPSGREGATEPQAEILLAMEPAAATHVVAIAEATGLRTDTVRSRLYKLDRKHLVVAVAGEVFCNRWQLTARGRAERGRLERLEHVS